MKEEEDILNIFVVRDRLSSPDLEGAFQLLLQLQVQQCKAILA